MNIQLKSGAPTALASEVLLLGVHEDEPTQGLETALGERVREAIELGIFKPEANETFVMTGVGKAKRVVLVGLGKRAELKPERVRQAMGTGIRAARDLKAKRASAAGFALASDRELVQALVEGAELGHYQFEGMRGKGTEEPAFSVDHLTLLLPKVTSQAEAGLDAGLSIAESVNWVRTLVNLPGRSLNATDLAREARTMAEPRGIKVRIYGKKELEKMGMNCLLAVNAGSTQPPAFIVLEYWGGKKGAKPYALVGKGITFDTGGICIKPAAGLEEMKSDMGGAGAVLGAMRVIADLKLPINVVGCIASTDNMPSGSAYRPGDVYTSYKGLTVEVVDTDAEGRVVLSDALAYADKTFNPKVTIDLATLTGSIIVALGGHVTGLFSNDQELADKLYQAGQETGEKVWPMPMWDVYDDMLESDIADLRNVAKRRGDAIMAAKFLSKFAGEHAWAHLDIAGPSWIDEDRPYEAKGGTGHGVRLLVEYLRNEVKA